MLEDLCTAQTHTTKNCPQAMPVTFPLKTHTKMPCPWLHTPACSHCIPGAEHHCPGRPFPRVSQGRLSPVLCIPAQILSPPRNWHWRPLLPCPFPPTRPAPGPHSCEAFSTLFIRFLLWLYSSGVQGTQMTQRSFPFLVFLLGVPACLSNEWTWE